MGEFYHIFIEPKAGVTREQVEEKMNLALDWFRCNSNVWVLYTTSDKNKLQTRLKPLVKPKGSLFICKLDIYKRNGFMTQKFWDWINKNIKK